MTFAPTSSSFFFTSSASSFLAPSFKGLGADSTSSLASFNPRAVISLTIFITLIFSDPASSKTMLNSVFSAAGVASPAAGAGAAATATGAAASIPNIFN